jgi:anti-anti-sigma factor
VIDREWPDVRGGDGPRSFSVRPSVQAGEVIVEVVGELDLATAPLLDEVLLRAGAVATGRVVVDVSHLTFMGAAGLSVLVGAHYRLLTKDETIRARLPCADLRSWWRDTVTEWSRNGRGLLVAGPSSWPSCSSRRWCQWWRCAIAARRRQASSEKVSSL